jgi:hypothetical protein
MARPRQGVTLENASLVKDFFKEALSDYSRACKVVADGGHPFEAEGALCKVSDVSYCNIEAYQNALERIEKKDSKIANDLLESAKQGCATPNPDELDAWVLKYVSEKGWRRCLNNLRQSRHAAKAGRQKAQIKLDRSTVWALKRLAEEEGLSIDQLLINLIEKRAPQNDESPTR